MPVILNKDDLKAPIGRSKEAKRVVLDKADCLKDSHLRWSHWEW